MGFSFSRSQVGGSPSSLEYLLELLNKRPFASAEYLYLVTVVCWIAVNLLFLLGSQHFICHMCVHRFKVLSSGHNRLEIVTIFFSCK